MPRRRSGQGQRSQAPQQPVIITDADLEDMAEEARQLGMVTRQLVIERLRRKIARDYGHLQYRRDSGRHTSYDEITAEDDLILALAIQMLKEEP